MWTQAQLRGWVWTLAQLRGQVWTQAQLYGRAWAGSDTGSAVSTRLSCMDGHGRCCLQPGLPAAQMRPRLRKPILSHPKCAGQAQDHAPLCDVPDLRACHPLVKDRLRALPERICSAWDSVCPHTARAGRASDDCCALPSTPTLQKGQGAAASSWVFLGVVNSPNPIFCMLLTY